MRREPHQFPAIAISSASPSTTTFTITSKDALPLKNVRRCYRYADSHPNCLPRLRQDRPAGEILLRYKVTTTLTSSSDAADR